MITNRGIKVWPDGFEETFCAIGVADSKPQPIRLSQKRMLLIYSQNLSKLVLMLSKLKSFTCLMAREHIHWGRDSKKMVI